MQGQNVDNDVLPILCGCCWKHPATLHLEFGTIMTGDYCELPACLDHISGILCLTDNEISYTIEGITQ